MSAMRTRLPVSGCLLLSAFCLTPIAFAQKSWWKTYGGKSEDRGYSVKQTSDGSYIITGYTCSFDDDGDAYVIKTDASGLAMWTRTYGGPDGEYGSSIQQTSDGGYAIAGLTVSFGAGGGDVYLIKTDASGDTLWTRTYGGTDADVGNSVQQTSDGCYIVAGSTKSFGAGGADVYLIKANISGDALWTRTYGGSDHDEGYSVQQTTDGGYVIAGYTCSYGSGNADVYLIKTDASGDTLWTRTYGGTSWAAGSSVQQTLDGGYIIAGATNGTGGDNVYLVKTDSSGDTMWTRTYGGGAYDAGQSVQQTSDGGYIVSGLTGSFGAGSVDVYLIRTNASGDSLWTRTYGGPNYDVGYSVQQTSDGGYIIAGETQSFGAGPGDVYLIKTDSLGNVGIAEENGRLEAPSRKLAATVIHSLPRGAAAFDAMGRRSLYPKPGVYFLKTTATAAPQKIQLVR
jgi:hypothetical protein